MHSRMYVFLHFQSHVVLHRKYATQLDELNRYRPETRVEKKERLKAVTDSKGDRKGS